jgi:hypothetical protein
MSNLRCGITLVGGVKILHHTTRGVLMEIHVFDSDKRDGLSNGFFTSTIEDHTEATANL